MCETVNQQSISSHVVVYMACKMRCRWLTFRRCSVNRVLSRNRSLRAAKPARHIFVWFVKHCLAEHCLSFRGDADECEKQFCFRVSHLFSVFWLSFVAALREQETGKSSILAILLICLIMKQSEYNGVIRTLSSRKLLLHIIPLCTLRRILCM